MLFSKSIPLGFLLFCLFNQSALGASSLNHFCFSHENYTANSPYDAYLTRLLILLQTKVPPTGFGLASTGQGEKKANGLALCRGDVSSKDCTTCVVDASKDIREFCPNSQGAIIWDLSGPDCKKCLDEAISELPNCCDAKRGGRVVGGSCHVGFELYPIVGT
ncbi:hypothetical protein M0R45_008380 [Rubus argutus]|uniref:Gnk2-homologous domain-containing protein n=1 Tax=Rubus argutus TaxID=59490 RepID=A0AAW1Y2X7_RUBAR